MTAKEASKHIGRKVSVLLGGLWIPCEVIDVKMAYGTLRYQVTAGNGGAIWINADRAVGGDKL